MNACACGNLQLVQYATEVLHMDVNIKNRLGQTALAKACSFGHKLIVQYLITKYNADVFISNALVAAMRTMQLHIAEYLVTDVYMDTRKPIMVSQGWL